MNDQTPLSQHHPDRLHARIVELGEAWADADAAAALLEETKKVVAARLFLNAAGKSVAEREAMALASDDYRQHIASMVEARRVAQRAKVKYDGSKTWVDMVRSLESTERTRMQLGG